MTLAFKDYLALMAHYNEVMNAKLVTLLTPMATTDLVAPRGAFFGSLLGTLNHILVADLLWLRRIRPPALRRGPVSPGCPARRYRPDR
ncbi:MAG: DinB family protein, partial [Asticcacaulis sp.]